MIKTIVIEDEAKSRSSLCRKLNEFCPGVKIVAQAEDGLEGLKCIEEYKPQLIFLDIEMPKLNGFEMLERIREKNFQIVFTTAYDQYAIKAFKYSAFDYLLKPVDIEELKSVVEKINTKEALQTQKQLELLQQNLMHPKKHLNKLAIPTVDGLLFYDIRDIIQLEAHRNYTNIIFENHTSLLSSKTLKEFEELLPGDIFFRTHHSHLINLNYIKRYIKGDGGQIELQNGNCVNLSRRKKDEFLKAIGR